MIRKTIRNPTRFDDCYATQKRTATKRKEKGKSYHTYLSIHSHYYNYYSRYDRVMTRLVIYRRFELIVTFCFVFSCFSISSASLLYEPYLSI
ncbi:uncharacterized protein BO88DRAFT_10365 [Aspergillus vadensis CBS 113365]|uniref:Uncharacterized protein n=1 Tax=Aspergillus vadensis (strain CBS 113365 / IMI 142717 / IBT 24658) TaxID=1448311 RepID=A0A319BPT7_ASPVC|nr:hypothetical protein BO88DRAFT_10365 [Aspergillus vadensis CBS 113365]PYH74414.1 hypothetical protein BO88DRAFT_10365 [Aspergillus vadensis CBS 113365]